MGGLFEMPVFAGNVNDVIAVLSVVGNLLAKLRFCAARVHQVLQNKKDAPRFWSVLRQRGADLTSWVAERYLPRELLRWTGIR